VALESVKVMDSGLRVELVVQGPGVQAPLAARAHKIVLAHGPFVPASVVPQ
jgi:hypothetical protein